MPKKGQNPIKSQRKNICPEYKTLNEIGKELNISESELIQLSAKYRSELFRFSAMAKDDVYYNIEAFKSICKINN